MMGQKRRWLVYIVLAATLCGLIAVGVTVVLLQAQAARNSTWQKMEQDGDVSATNIGQALESSLASIQLGVPRTARRPRAADFLAFSNATYEEWFSLAPTKSPQQVMFLYAGRPQVIYPMDERAEVFKSLDTLNPQPPFSASLYNYTLSSMRTGRAVIADVADSGQNALMILAPVFVDAANATEMWDWPANVSATGCLTGKLPCYNATAKKKWWGQVSVTISLKLLADSSAMQRLRKLDYGYSVEVVVANEMGAPQYSRQLYSNMDQVTCLSSQARLVYDRLDLGLQAVVHLCATSDWEVSWKIPVLVVVVVVPVALMTLILFTVLTWMRHSELMQSLLSPDAIKHLTHHMPTGGNTGEKTEGTPAEKLTAMLDNFLVGKVPAAQDVVEMLGVLKRPANLFVPKDLEDQVRQAANMDGEVARALMAALVEPTADRAPLVSQDSQMISSVSNLASPSRSTGADLATHLLSGRQVLDAIEEKSGDELFEVLKSITGLLSVTGSRGDTLATAASEAALPLEHNSGECMLDAFNIGSGGSRVEVANASRGGRNKQKMVFCEVSYEEEDVCMTTFNNGEFILAGNSPQISPVLQLERVLTLAVTLDGEFDVWTLHDAALGHPLSALGFYVFHQSGVMQELGISSAKLVSFLRAVESGYQDNPYHNRTHAADVLQSIHALLHTGAMRGKYADSFTTAACYLAAVMHDHDHQGVTNDYLVTTRHELAIVYNDRSPHENHHCASGFKLLSMPQHNFLSHMPGAEWARMRKLVIDLVLATDMKQHFAVNGAFSSVHRLSTASAVNKITQRSMGMSSSQVSGMNSQATIRFVPSPTATTPETPSNKTSVQNLQTQRTHVISTAGSALSPVSERLPLCRSADGEDGRLSGSPTRPGRTPVFSQANAFTLRSAAFALPTPPTPKHETFAVNSFVVDTPAPLDEAERLLSLQMMLKCADLGHISTNIDVHLKWVTALQEEMFQQGDKERAQGLPCSPLCDRNGMGITKSQTGFFEVVVLPLLSNFTTRFPASASILRAAASNYSYWRAQVEARTSMSSSART